MPRKPNVSAEAVNDLVSQADDLTMEMLNATEEIKAGRVDDLNGISDKARKLALLASHAADLAAMLLLRADIQERDRELKKLRAGEAS